MCVSMKPNDICRRTIYLVVVVVVVVLALIVIPVPVPVVAVVLFGAVCCLFCQLVKKRPWRPIVWRLLSEDNQFVLRAANVCKKNSIRF